MFEVAVATTPKAPVCSYLLCEGQAKPCAECAALHAHLYDLTMARAHWPWPVFRVTVEKDSVVQSECIRSLSCVEQLRWASSCWRVLRLCLSAACLRNFLATRPHALPSSHSRAHFCNIIPRRAHAQAHLRPPQPPSSDPSCSSRTLSLARKLRRPQCSFSTTRMSSSSPS